MRLHPRVLASLRLVEAEQGMSEDARQYASGAIFELDEALRQKVKQKAAAVHWGLVRASLQSRQVVPTSQHLADQSISSHVMLSYDWLSQIQMKRLNLSLKARNYRSDICSISSAR